MTCRHFRCFPSTCKTPGLRRFRQCLCPCTLRWEDLVLYRKSRFLLILEHDSNLWAISWRELHEVFEAVLKASHLKSPEVKSGNYQTLETLLKSSPPTEVGVWVLDGRQVCDGLWFVVTVSRRRSNPGNTNGRESDDATANVCFRPVLHT